jgi:hypothetical protein
VKVEPRPVFAVDGDRAVEKLGIFLDDVEAEADAAVRTGLRAVDLMEDLEDTLDHVLLDSDTGIHHVELDRSRRRL